MHGCWNQNIERLCTNIKDTSPDDFGSFNTQSPRKRSEERRTSSREHRGQHKLQKTYSSRLRQFFLTPTAMPNPRWPRINASPERLAVIVVDASERPPTYSREAGTVSDYLGITLEFVETTQIRGISQECLGIPTNYNGMLESYLGRARE